MARQKDSLRAFLSHYYVTREGIELTEITHHVQNIANPSLTMPPLLGEDSSFNEFNHEQILYGRDCHLRIENQFHGVFIQSNTP